MKVEIEIDEKDYGLLCSKREVKEVMSKLNDLYCKIYIESSYDPFSQETQNYALGLLPLIERLNEILKFKA